MNNILKESIDYLRNYYLDWQDYIERFSFPRMDYYYLLINISSFYKVLDLLSKKLEEWDNEDEISLFYILSYMPKKIIFSKNIYSNFRIIREALEHNKLVLEENKEYQETN